MNDADIIAGSLRTIANTLTPLGGPPGEGATGGTVGSLTEAVMDLAAAVVRVAEVLENRRRVT